MPEDVAAEPFTDRNIVFRCASEDALQIRPFRRKIRQDNAAVPRIVRNKRANIEVGIIRVSIVDEFDGRANAGDMRLDHFGGTGRACDRDVRFDADGDFEFESQPTEIRALHGRTRSMDAPGKHDTRDRMIDPAKGLHRSGRKPDLVAHGVAVFVAKRRYVSLLDIVGVWDGRGPVRRTKRPEPYIGLVFGEQGFGRAPGRDILHRSLSFSSILTCRGLPSNDGGAVSRRGVGNPETDSHKTALVDLLNRLNFM